jgi:hypothetical protein
MGKTQNEQKTKPKLDATLSDWLELFYLQAVLPEQNDTIPLPTIKHSATLRYNALCFKFRYVQRNSATSGNTVYKLPLATLQ